MTILLAEGFDPYAAVTDMPGWTIGNVLMGAASHTPFSIGQSLSIINTGITTYGWNSNEATVYGSIFFQSNGGSSSSQYTYLSFRDGATAQVTIRWNMDGSIGLYSGGPTGTLISTTTLVFTGGTIVTSTWSSFQFKIVIDATVGSIEIRVNGSPTNTITATGVNTRAGTSNNYVNTFGFACTISGNGYVDDLYLTTTGWPGEMRALQQRPTSVVTPNFSVFPTTGTQAVGIFASNTSKPANTAYYFPFVATITGTVNSVTFQMNANLTGNVKIALYDSTGTGGTPGTVLASNSINNPVTTANTVTLSGSPILTLGSTYHLAWNQDAAATYRITASATSPGYSASLSYASFPTNAPSVGTISNMTLPVAVINVTVNNAAGVQELTQDGDTSYIYTSSNVEDKYHLSPIATTYAVSAVQYYALWKKTDAGYRTASLSVDVGAGDTNIITTVPPTIGSYTYTIKTMELDPTGAAWTPTSVNGAILGIAGGS